MKTYVITTAIIKDGEKYLIAKRAATKRFAPNEWEFIAGFIDELLPAEEITLKEIREELGAEGEILATSDPFEVTDNEGRWIIIPYLVALKDPAKASINAHDHSDMRWATIQELQSYEYIKEVLASSSVQSLLKKL